MFACLTQRFPRKCACRFVLLGFCFCFCKDLLSNFLCVLIEGQGWLGLGKGPLNVMVSSGYVTIGQG